MLEKEKLVKEQRLGEATDRNYIGLEGKFGIILKYLGKPVMYQGAANYETTEWVNVADMPEEEGIPEEDPDAPIREIGKTFDGLKFGYHLEISYMKAGTVPVRVDEYHTRYVESTKVLKVTWKGYIVYLEAEGDLMTFTPSPDWEEVVLKIYEAAIKLKRQHYEGAVENAATELKAKKVGFLQYLRERWGI